MPKKQSHKVDYYAAADANDNFGIVYDSMCKNANYQRLSVGAKQFYTLCRVQSRTKRGQAYLFKYAESEGKTFNDNCFVFPSSHMEIYGVERQNGSKYMNQLIELGFIRCVEQNAHRHRPNVYAFDSKWKDTS